MDGDGSLSDGHSLSFVDPDGGTYGERVIGAQTAIGPELHYGGFVSCLPPYLSYFLKAHSVHIHNLIVSKTAAATEGNELLSAAFGISPRCHLTGLTRRLTFKRYN